MNIFRITVIGIFALFLILAVLIFSGLIDLGGGEDEQGIGGTVVLWGTVPEEELAPALEDLRLEYTDEFRLEYVEKRRRSFDRALVEALASGTGPDMVLLPDDLIVRHSDKLFAIPYESFSLRRFKDTFVEEGELYLRDNGILALPFLIDPLVLYWNRDIFTAEGVVEPPSYWDELFSLAPQFTRTTENLTITRSAIALGEYENIENAKDILALLTLQAGDPIVEERDRGLESVLGEKHGFVDAPAVSALRFYTEFSNSTKPFYSWNGSLPNDKEYFTRGDSAMYMGFASEYGEIEARNPQLNFDVVRVPQVRDTERVSTKGDMMGVAILRSSRKPQTAYFVSSLITGPRFVSQVIEESTRAPARRDLLREDAGDAVSSVFNNSALISRSWLDPNPQATEQIFKEMIEGVVSGRSRLTEAVSRASKQLDTFLSQ